MEYNWTLPSEVRKEGVSVSTLYLFRITVDKIELLKWLFVAYQDHNIFFIDGASRIQIELKSFDIIFNGNDIASSFIGIMVKNSWQNFCS